MKKFLLRKEHFGGTLFSTKTGKRVYVSKDEFLSIEGGGAITEYLNEDVGEIKIAYPNLLFESGFSSPDTIFLEVTRACNLSCKHCFNDSGRRMEGEIGIEKQKMIIGECVRLGVQEIRFTGGEPLVSNHVYDLIHEASQNNLRVSMGTNGTLITRENARRLFVCGLDMAIVSIDGTEKSHDALRGQGNFQKSINGILNLREQNINVRVNIVAVKPNLKDIPSVVEFFHKLGVGVFVRRFIPLGRSADVASNFFLNSDDYDWLKREIGIYLDDPSGMVRGHYLSDECVKSRITLLFSRRDCSAGQRAFVIDPQGNVQLCGFMNQVATIFSGDISDESLEQIWHRIITENPIGNLTKKLESYNTVNMKTNCFAIALASHAK